MRQALKLHPTASCGAVARFEVDVMRPGRSALALRYVFTGSTGDLRFPPPKTPSRSDDLWRTTCFETFVRPPTGQVYYEFNFSPSGDWATYRFDGYRSGMSAPPRAAAPLIALVATERRIELE